MGVKRTAPGTTNGSVSPFTTITLPSTVSHIPARIKRKKKYWLAVAGLLIFAGVLAGLLAAYLSPQTPALMVALDLNSDPAGAAVTLNGKAAGQTPARLRLPAGKNRLELSRKDYAVYNLDLEVSVASTGTGLLEQAETSPAVAATPLLTSTTPLPAAKESNSLPLYSLKINLTLAVAKLTGLEASLPGSQILRARFLPAMPNVLELTEQVEGSGPLTAGKEGIATGLWLYDTTTQTSRPVIISYQAAETVLDYYRLPSEAASNGSVGLTRLVFLAPTLSPDGRNLAVISHLLPVTNQFNSARPATTSSGTAPGYDRPEQAVWLMEMAERPSASGAALAGALTVKEGKESGSAVKRIANLADVSSLQPLEKAVLEFESVNWNPDGKKLLLSLKTRSDRNLNSTGTNTLLAVAELQNQTIALVTPLPLPTPILPGTIRWRGDSQSVSFLVKEAGQGTGLCVLDLIPAASNSSTNTLHYLGKLAAKGLWSENSPVNAPYSGGKSYPPGYGSLRYNPLAWVGAANHHNSNISSYPSALYTKTAPYWAISQNRSFDTLYAYPPLEAGEPQPLNLDRKYLEQHPEARENPSTDSYPFVSTGPAGIPQVFYLAGRLKQSSGGFLGGSTYLEISLNQLDLAQKQDELTKDLFGSVTLKPATQQPAPGGSVSSRVEVKLIRAYSSPAVFPALDDSGSSQFEAEVRPDGKAAIVAVTTNRGSRRPQFWLAVWH